MSTTPTSTTPTSTTPTSTTPTVTREEAERVLALVAETFKPYWAACDPAERPTVDHRGGHPVIRWESGSPFEWALMFPGGGHDEEMAALAAEFSADSSQIAGIARVAPATLPQGVRAEAVDSFTIALYREP